MTRTYCRTGYEREHFGRCELHGQPCCSVCCRHEGECDFGTCTRPAVTMVDCFGPGGRLAERRSACDRHANYTPLGVGYGLTKALAS